MTEAHELKRTLSEAKVLPPSENVLSFLIEKRGAWPIPGGEILCGVTIDIFGLQNYLLGINILW